MYQEIKACRLCKSSHLENILSLGDQTLTGVFPKNVEEPITRGPVDLLWCTQCELVQLRQSYNLAEMYGENYGYRSGLNASMVSHLRQKAHMLQQMGNPLPGELIIDIGSNDATSLKAYNPNLERVGIDPTGAKFKSFYSSDLKLIPDFFTAEKFFKAFPNKKAKIISSIAMFYDLEDPAAFVKDIVSVLQDDGLWHFEQSYMPSMLRTNSYDTICHEHLEFYSLKVIKSLLERFDLRIVDVQLNSINGGSFAVTACKAKAAYKSNKAVIDWLLNQEREEKLNTCKPYLEFAERVKNHRDRLSELVNSLVDSGKKIFGYGASTKGNVLLQYCGFTKDQINFIAEVNEEKFGKFTPATHIPIISEKEARDKKPDYFLVLPWHFKAGIVEREKAFLEKGGRLIFPLPEIEII